MRLAGKHLPARDFLTIVAALIAVTLLAWFYLLWSAAAMEMSGGGTPMMSIPVWNSGYFLMMFLMWAVMMVGMMVPSVIPTVMIYAAVARKSEASGHTVAPAGVFVSGYIAVWAIFSLLATIAQMGLDSAALLSPMMVSSSPWLGAILLISAGVYQFLPIKKSCLSHCRSPVHWLAKHWKRGISGAFRLGAKHGVYCLGCCWVIMLLLFVGGVMNLLWVAMITIFVLLEKVLPLGDAGGRIVGLVMIIAGGAFIYSGN